MSSTTKRHGSSEGCYFEVFLSKESFKFNAAHFVAYRGFRERLHGHNYRMSIRLIGNRTISSDGYLIDFGCVKKAAKDVCKEMNEHFLCPMHSDVIDIKISEVDENKNGSIQLKCEDGSQFLFPKQDCLMLPIVHATTEELSIYLWGKMIDKLDVGFLREQDIHVMEVTISEAPGQESVFRMSLPDIECSNAEKQKLFDVTQYIRDRNFVPVPCQSCP